MPRVESRSGVFTVENGIWTGDNEALVAWLNRQNFGEDDVRRALEVAALLDGDATDFPPHNDVRG